ncbi:MAG: histidinol-phosphatase [Halothiobacillus sp.]
MTIRPNHRLARGGEQRHSNADRTHKYGKDYFGAINDLLCRSLVGTLVYGMGCGYTFGPLGAAAMPSISRQTNLSQGPEDIMHLAIFDLDNTLIEGDSDHAWGQYLAEIGAVDRTEHAQLNQMFYEEYQRGTLDMQAFLKFSLAPLARYPLEQLFAWRAQFVADIIAPMIKAPALKLVEHHRQKGDELMIITATNAFITEPIAALFSIEHLLATQPAVVDGRYTGEYVGIPTFQKGKQIALDQWLTSRQLKPSTTWFYSDSCNDIPLLATVDQPVAVDPDTVLRHHAEAKGWPIISLRS